MMLGLLTLGFIIHFNGTDPAFVDNKYLVYPRGFELDIPDTAKLVQIQSAEFQYPDVIISGKNCTMRGFAHEKGLKSESPCVLEPTNRYEYNLPKQGFSILGFLKNPTMLMTFVSFGLMFAMPKLMESMEEEQGKDKPKDISDLFLAIK